MTYVETVLPDSPASTPRAQRFVSMKERYEQTKARMGFLDYIKGIFYYISARILHPKQTERLENEINN